MPITNKKDENPFARTYKPFPYAINGVRPDQCVPAVFNTPAWNRPQFDYGSLSRYGQTYLSQGPANSPVESKSKSWDYAGKAQKIYDALKRTIDNKEQLAILKNLRPYTFIEVYDDIIENVPVRAWVRELESPAEEVLLNIGALDIELTVSRFEPTRITRAYDALESSVQKLMSKTQEIISRFTTAIEKMKQSPKLEPIKKALHMIVNKWPRLTSAIMHTLRVIRKLIPSVGTIMDIHEAKEKRDNWMADPFSEEKQKKYVIAVISVATNFVIGIVLDLVMRHPIGFCIGCLYLGYSVWFGMNDGDGDPAANWLYDAFPEAMTKYAMNVDSNVTWIYQQGVLVKNAIDSALDDIKDAAIAAADSIKRAGHGAMREGQEALDFSAELYARIRNDSAD